LDLYKYKGSVRASLYIYNTKEEIDFFFEKLEEIVKNLKNSPLKIFLFIIHIIGIEFLLNNMITVAYYITTILYLSLKESEKASNITVNLVEDMKRIKNIFMNIYKV